MSRPAPSRAKVWLTGTVGIRFQRDSAETAVAGPTGVRGIIDVIEIFSDTEAADVTDLVQRALDRYGVLPDDSDVQAGASDGTITLTGRSAPGPNTTRRSTPRGEASAPSTSAKTGSRVRRRHGRSAG